jgi:flagellar protein FlaG
MEPLGTLISRSANDTDHVTSARQMNQTRIAEVDAARRTVPGRETGSSPWSSKEVPSEKIDHIARALLNYVRSVQTDLSIEVHRGTGKIMVQVISKTDGKVIREIPPEELLDLAAKMEEVVGVIFNKNA